jgi:peroxidase
VKRVRKSLPRRAVRRLLKEFTCHSALVLEQRVLLSASSVLPANAVEPIGGTGNNVAHPAWGAAGNDLIRLTPAQYANGYSTPSLPQDPSARVVSNIINSQADPANPSQDIATVNQQSLSDFAYSFGQFMDHDMDLTQATGATDNIQVPVGDPIGGPNDTPLSFNLSQNDPATGTGPGNPAQQVNSISSYFDLSQVYGSDVATDNALRTFSGGQMKTSAGGLPPLDNLNYFSAAQLAAINVPEGGMADDGPVSQSQMFVTGDTRGNENVELTVLQTLFLDNHNRLAAELQKENPSWSDQQLFDTAREINIAQYQSIIYNEWIPAVLGANALPAYKGYNPNVNASIANEFSTVAFRFGHSLLSGDVERQGNNGQAVAADVPLAEDFFDPTILNGEGQPSGTDPVTGLVSTDIGAVLKGDADGDAQAEDTQVINEVRNELFNEVVPGVGYGQDLIALDVQRGRVNGIGSYNEVRESLGLPAVTSFSQITSNVTVQKELQAAYGNVNNIDAFEGGLAEDPVAGSDVGPLFQAIMVNQFTRLRDGDRFFYLNETFTPQEQALFNQGNTLTKVIEANTNITNLQSDAFIFQASIGGTVSMSAGKHSVGIPGITVQLEDTSGDILATTTTSRNGQYSFNQLSGPAANVENPSGVSGTGTYQIVLSLPSWLQQTGRGPGSIAITRGGQNVSGVNFNIGINWNNLSTTPGANTAASNLASLVSVTPVQSTGLVQSTGTTTGDSVTTSSAATNSSGSAVQSTAGATTSTASSTATSPSGALTPESLVAFLESLGRAATTGAAASVAQGGSPPSTEWALDSAFGPAEFANIVDQLS